MVIVTFRNFVVMQANCNKKQILAMKYQVWISAFLKIFVFFGVFLLLKKLFRWGLDRGHSEKVRHYRFAKGVAARYIFPSRVSGYSTQEER